MDMYSLRSYGTYEDGRGEAGGGAAGTETSYEWETKQVPHWLEYL